MMVHCAVCENPIESDEAYSSLESSTEEAPLYFCSERCLLDFEEEPELFLGEDAAEEELPIVH